MGCVRLLVDAHAIHRSSRMASKSARLGTYGLLGAPLLLAVAPNRLVVLEEI
jgi:hypothetical protein